MNQQKTVLEKVLEWSQERPEWQKDALRRIVQKGKLDNNDISNLVYLAKQKRGGDDSKSKPEPLQQSHLPSNPGAGSSVTINSLKDILGANALAKGQILPFSKEGITVIYGDNGAGKSGYARILKRACRARYPGEIHSNIYEASSGTPASATFEISVGDVPQPEIKWNDGDTSHRVLSAVSVFDSECASVHLQNKNEVAFRPFGLDVPDELASACQLVKEALAEEQLQLQKAKHPIFLNPPWHQNTKVGKAVASLKYDFDPQVIKDLADLTEDERSRGKQLKEDLSKDPAKAAAEQKNKADNIKRIVDSITVSTNALTDEVLKQSYTEWKIAKEKRAAAKLAAEKAFADEKLEGVGSEPWRTLWEAARRYSTESAYKSFPFPFLEEGARCVLCQQKLEAEAGSRKRLLEFETFIKEDIEKQAKNAETSAAASLARVVNAKISTRSITANLKDLMLLDKITAKKVRRYFASVRVRRYESVRAIKQELAELKLSNLEPIPQSELTQIETKLRNYAEELIKSAKAEERKKLETELQELVDRAYLHAKLQTVIDEIERLKQINFLELCQSDTATQAITKMGNDIADSVITPQLRDRFQQEIVRLAADKVRVEIVRSGGKFGSPQYQIRFFAKPDAKIASVLSEGEKTCVALAAFLTELATANDKSTLIFDDPVSSLDHRWRKRVAKRLVDESEHRQIIIFSHDLIFVNDIVDLGAGQGRTVKFLTVCRESIGAGVVAEGLPWKAQSVEDRLDKLAKEAREAKLLYDSNEEAKYTTAAVRVYGHLRATWERAIEEIAFFKVVRRHRDYIDSKYLKKASVLTENDCDLLSAGYKKCCDVVDAHDPSIGRNAEPPEPTELLQDVKNLEDWVIGIRAKQKLIQ